MKIPDTIRKTAEEAAVKATEEVVSICTEAQLEELEAYYVEGYLACYEKLMSGGADGWTVIGTERDARPSIDDCTSNHDSILDDFGDAVNYNIIPVKIIKMEE